MLSRCFVAGEGAAIADLTRLGPGEILVEWINGEDADALLEWAQLVGHTRVWLPDRLVDLELTLVPEGRAEVECPTCGAHWSEGEPRFWANVRRWGYFPSFCLGCGGSLPEWSVTVRSMVDDPTYR